MNISTQTIQDIKVRVSPVQAIEQYTMQQGRRGRFLCPFHDDHDPSVTVKGNRWTCWSCGASGDVIDFTRQFYNLGFNDAVAKLGADFGVPLEAEQSWQTDPSFLEARILAEIDRKNKREYREWLNGEIDKYTIVYRVLMQHDAPSEILDEYAAMIDAMILDPASCFYNSKLTPFEEALSAEIQKRSKDEALKKELFDLISTPFGKEVRE